MVNILISGLLFCPGMYISCISGPMEDLIMPPALFKEIAKNTCYEEYRTRKYTDRLGTASQRLDLWDQRDKVGIQASKHYRDEGGSNFPCFCRREVIILRTRSQEQMNPRLDRDLRLILWSSGFQGMTVNSLLPLGKVGTWITPRPLSGLSFPLGIN